MEAIKSGKTSSAQKAIRDHLKLAMGVIRQGYWEKNSKKKRKRSATKAQRHSVKS
jgi:hypothetical protein